MNALKSLCLVMIVKNEGAVIQRCLHSVKNYIDHWIICDTGSTDNTRELIRHTLAAIPGELHSHPWVDFGHNRTLSLQLAAGKADYLLLLDADMVLNVREEFRHKLDKDFYFVRTEGPSDYSVERLLSGSHHWQFRGVTHEYIASDTAQAGEKLPELSVTHFHDGGSRADKYERDIRLLTAALQQEPGDSRSVFYLAQSYRDHGDLPLALQYYFQRAGMGGWEEETWYSLYMIARLQHRIGASWPVCLAAYLQAFNFRPKRLEPIYWIARFYREHGQNTLALLFARLSQEIGYPDDCLFIDREIYEKLLPQEYELLTLKSPCSYPLPPGLHLPEASQLLDAGHLSG